MLCSLAWGLGYGGMWALKWGINALVFSPDLLRGVHDQIALRLSSVSGENQLSRLSVLLSNLDIVLAKPAFLLILGIGRGCFAGACAQPGAALRPAPGCTRAFAAPSRRRAGGLDAFDGQPFL